MAAPIFVADELVTATKMNLLPKGVLGYAQVVANQAGIGTTEVDLTGLTVTVTVPAGRRVRISGYVVAGSAAAMLMRALIHKASAQIQSAYVFSAGAAGAFDTLTPMVVDSPTAGTHTYKLRGLSSTSTWTLTAGATIPNWILVEDIGSAT